MTVQRHSAGALASLVAAHTVSDGKQPHIETHEVTVLVVLPLLSYVSK